MLTVNASAIEIAEFFHKLEKYFEYQWAMKMREPRLRSSTSYSMDTKYQKEVELLIVTKAYPDLTNRESILYDEIGFDIGLKFRDDKFFIHVDAIPNTDKYYGGFNFDNMKNILCDNDENTGKKLINNFNNCAKKIEKDIEKMVIDFEKIYVWEDDE